MIHRVVDSALPLELMGSPANSTKVSEIDVILTTSATAGNRTPQLELRASTKQICDMANWQKAAYNALKDKLNADTGVKDTDYAAVSTAAATSLTTAYALLNAIKAALNTLHAKLDLDAGVALTVYAAQVAISSADSTTPATAITLANEILVNLRRLCNLLDGESTVADEDYESTIMAGAAGCHPPALTTSSTKNASAATTASKTAVRHRFSTAVTDGNGTGYVNTAITEYTIPIGACIAVNIATPVDATNDKVTIDVSFI